MTTAEAGQRKPSRSLRIVPIIKTVGVACNLKCDYCWFNPLDQSKVRRMPDDVLERLVTGYAEVDASNRYQFVWHGGEPLLAGRPFFERALALQREHMPRATVKNLIQTNATLLTDAWVDFFLENRFKVGVSLDGPAEMHDRHRRTAAGRGSHARVMERLEQAAKRGLRFSVIATVSAESAEEPDRLFRFFVDHGVRSFGFNMVYERQADGQPAPWSVTSEQYASFQKRVFDLWLAEDDQGVRIRHVDNIVRGMAGLPVKSCIYAGTCSRFINVDSNGDVPPYIPLVAESVLVTARESFRQVRAPKVYQRDHPDFPLRGTARCSCGQYLTSCWSAGNQCRYAYYRCMTCRRVNLPKDAVETWFLSYLGSVREQFGLTDPVREGMIEAWREDRESAQSRRARLANEIEETTALQKAVALKNAQGVIPDDIAREQIQELADKLALNRSRLADGEAVEEDVQTVIDWSANFIQDLEQRWQSADIQGKKEIQSFFCPEGRTVELPSKFRTGKGGPLAGSRPSSFVQTSNTVAGVRFELTTSWL